MSVKELYEMDNLNRAWRWIRSNSNPTYKQYFRDLYGVYAVASDLLLKDLQDRLRRGVYEPGQSCKIYFPKSSGILRPYSLLTVEDQIAFQAATNVVAEKLAPRVRSRYSKEVFGHLYAGKSSTWFYRKWSKGYKAFNDAARQAFDDGMRMAASFDLTACYDSIDHGVLSHFLGKIGCETEMIELLTSWLSKWTATQHGILHNHGIPQGPLSSGLLSEVVLQHFDANRGKPKSVCYLRYVDDIRLFAKTERQLRQMLIRLDTLSKDIGLFPQSSKIEIHEVTDIEAELKSVSNPPEPAVTAKPADQKKIRKRLAELSPRFSVSDGTRFKYVLASATPSSTLTTRLWRIYEKSPEFYQSLARYLTGYETMPAGAGKRLVQEIKSDPLYAAVTAALLDAADSRMRAQEARSLDAIVKNRWKPRTLQPVLLASAGAWLLSRNKLTFAQTQYACQKLSTWWPRAVLTLQLTDKWMGTASLAKLANDGVRDSNSDVALAAAHIAAKHDVAISTPRRDVHKSASLVLKEYGLIRRSGPAICGVNKSIQRMVGSCSTVNWRRFFGSDYKKVERQVVLCKGLADTNATAWVNAMDVFNDWLLIGLYSNDPLLGTYAPGSIGSVVGSTRLKSKYPKTQALVEDIHDHRYASALSHAKAKRTGKATGPIKFSFIRIGKRLLKDAVSELATQY